MYVKYVGIRAQTAALIEARRQSASESEDEILFRELSDQSEPPVGGKEDSAKQHTLSLGQGVQVNVGEKLYLFLEKRAKDMRKPQGVAEVKYDGLYVDNVKIEASHGSLIQPAMRHFQDKISHRNAAGDIVSLSAYRQWHVIRDGNLVPIEELKDPALSRRRQRSLSKLTLEDLGL